MSATNDDVECSADFDEVIVTNMPDLTHVTTRELTNAAKQSSSALSAVLGRAVEQLDPNADPIVAGFGSAIN